MDSLRGLPVALSLTLACGVQRCCHCETSIHNAGLKCIPRGCAVWKELLEEKGISMSQGIVIDYSISKPRYIVLARTMSLLADDSLGDARCRLLGRQTVEDMLKSYHG
ncbi:hypothetical protein F5X97DRAFT_298105 [Nemania serpens]|nr:hypothetical protein F5X97DRAFT_298105 [Nemania serpens]